MASNPLLTLSRKGLLKGVAERADRVMAYYVTTDLSQTYLYKGQVKSFQGTIQQFNNDKVLLRQQVTADLLAMFTSVFDLADVTVTIEDTAVDGSNRMNIVIDVIITEAGVQYSLGSVIQSINGVFTQLIQQNS